MWDHSYRLQHDTILTRSVKRVLLCVVSRLSFTARAARCQFCQESMIVPLPPWSLTQSTCYQPLARRAIKQSARRRGTETAAPGFSLVPALLSWHFLQRDGAPLESRTLCCACNCSFCANCPDRWDLHMHAGFVILCDNHIFLSRNK